MKLRTKRPGWKSLMPLQLSRKSAMRFFLFPKVQAAGQSLDDSPVYLNVYDLTPTNGYIYWAGLGIFHSGIEGIEFESYEEASSEHGGGDASNPEEDIDLSDSLPLDSGEDM